MYSDTICNRYSTKPYGKRQTDIGGSLQTGSHQSSSLPLKVKDRASNELGDLLRFYAI